MQHPPRVHPWLTEAELEAWIDHATNLADYRRRLAIWWIASRGEHAYDVAVRLRVSRATVWSWLETYNGGGPEALVAHPRGGRRDAYLSLTQERRLLHALEPRAVRGESVIEADLHQAVENAVGHRVSPGYVRLLVRRHRWRKVAPRPRHPKADPTMQANFTIHVPALVSAIADEVPRGKPLRVLFEDEASFGRISETRRCWAPPGVRPTVPHQYVRDHLQALAAVCPRDGRMRWSLAPHLDADAMSAFLAATRRRLPRDYCAIFLDGAGRHIAQTLRVPKHMRLVFLLPYSPELNPVEPLWGNIREKYFADRLFTTLRAVDQRLRVAFEDLEGDPDLVRSIANFNWLKSPGLM